MRSFIDVPAIATLGLRAARLVVAISLAAPLASQVEAIEITDGTVYPIDSRGEQTSEVRQPAIRLTGELAPGDTQKVARYFKSINPSGDREQRVRFELSFVDGDYGEALKLASFFRSQALSTIVRSGDACKGPCGIAFMGGTAPFDEEAYLPPSRCLLPGGELSIGLPAFSLDARFSQVSESGRAVRQQAFLFFVALLRTTTDHYWPEPIVRSLFEAGAGSSLEITADLYNKKSFSAEVFYLGSPCRFWHE